MAPKISQHQLLLDLENDNKFFDLIVDMIPAKLYVHGHSGDDYNPKYFKGQSKESKEARRAQNKEAKRAKLDPNLAESTTQTKKRLEGGRPLMPPATSAKPAAGPATPVDASSTLKTPDFTSNKSRIEALREKLHAKLAEKRGQRPTDPNVVSKRAARRAEKKKRQEEAAKRKKATKSHAEGNDKSKKYKLEHGAASSKDDPAADLANLDFGRLAGLNPISRDQYQKTNKSLANLSKSKNLQKMLADAEAKRLKLEELKKGSEEEKQKAANIQWGDAIKEASGERVKDDPAKLKKALKRQAVKKQKSAKAWKSRMEQSKQKADERQKIRQHNLSKRKMGGSAGANLSKRRIVTEDEKAAKKAPRAGFEGRKQEFLNNKKVQ